MNTQAWKRWMRVVAPTVGAWLVVGSGTAYAGSDASAWLPRQMAIVGLESAAHATLSTARQQVPQTVASRIQTALTSRVTVEALVHQVYLARDFAPVWADSWGLAPEGRAVIQTLKDASAHGLDPTLWDVGQLEEWIAVLDGPDALAAAPSLLSVAVADPVSSLQAVLRVVGPDVRPSQLAAQVATSQDPDVAWWRDIAVPAVQAQEEARRAAAAALDIHLVDGLVRYARLQRLDNIANVPRTMQTGEGATTTRPAEARPDNRAIARWRQEVVAGLIEARGPLLQQRLDALAPQRAEYVALQNALASQRAMAQPGGWDPAWDDAALPSRRERMVHAVAAMDALRASQAGVDAPGISIRVNLPTQTGEVWRDDERLHTFRAVIGSARPAINRTPEISGTLSRMELNPWWYPPPRLARALTPSTATGIIRREGRLVQRPGPQNALGQVKFLFPNPHAVYLHDTNNRGLFAQDNRARSSGCVRVEDPLELAALLFALDQGLSGEAADTQIATWVETGRTTPVTFASSLDVHLEYRVASVDDDGSLQVHPDIYGRDRETLQQLRGRADLQ